MHGLIIVLAAILLLFSVKRGIGFNIIAAILCFVAIFLSLFSLSKGSTLHDPLIICSAAFTLFCDGAIIGFKKRS